MRVGYTYIFHVVITDHNIIIMLFVAFVCIVIGLSQLRLISNTCTRDTFLAWRGIRCGGAVIHNISQCVPLASCERTCRLYKECFGFNMEWSHAASESGRCSLLRSKTGYTNSTDITCFGNNYIFSVFD